MYKWIESFCFDFDILNMLFLSYFTMLIMNNVVGIKNM